jgi:hypothetical protein
MKFKKVIEMCRHDGDVPTICILTPQKGYRQSRDCSALLNGICRFDKKKCKVIVYDRRDK